ncbi:MAG: LPP20 family lipoprotein [Nitrospinales bacterium]
MSQQKSLWAVVGGILIVSLFSACASTPPLPPQRATLKDVEPPDWVMRGGGAFEDSDGKAFYGIGSAAGIKNYSLQRVAADDRARNDLAKVFEFYTKSLTKDYMASTTAGDFEASSEEQNVESAIKTITSATLNGVVIIDHWEHPRRNELFSLARLDLEKFKQNLDHYKELSQEVRDAVKKRADKLHEELEREVLKKEGKI